MKNPNIRILKTKGKKGGIPGSTKVASTSGGPPTSMISNDSTRVGTAADNAVTCLTKGP